METRNCKQCGAAFEPKRGPERYCSPGCRRAASLEQMREAARHRRRAKKPAALPQRACVICGATFAPGRFTQITCSPGCSKTWEKKSATERTRERRRQMREARAQQPPQPRKASASPVEAANALAPDVRTTTDARGNVVTIRGRCPGGPARRCEDPFSPLAPCYQCNRALDRARKPLHALHG